MAISANEISILIKARDDSRKAFKDVEKNASGLGKALSGVGKIAAGVFAGQAILGGVQKLGDLLISSVKAAADEEAAIARLKQAVDLTGVSYDKYAAQIEGAIEKGQEMAFTDDEGRSALALLMAQTGNAAEAMERFALAQDVARGAGIDLETASRLLGKVTDENANVFKRMGINLQEGATATEAFGELQAKFGGQAKAFADSTAGAMERAKIQMGELQESIGYLVLPAITNLADVAADNLPKVSAKIDEVRADFKEWSTSPDGQKIQEDARELGRTFTETMKSIGIIVEQTTTFISNNWKQLKPIFESVIAPLYLVRDVVKIVAAAIQGDWDAALKALKQLGIDFAVGGLTVFIMAWDSLRGGIANVMLGIAQAVEGGLNAAIRLFNSFAAQVDKVSGKISGFLKTVTFGKVELDLDIPKIDEVSVDLSGLAGAIRGVGHAAAADDTALLTNRLKNAKNAAAAFVPPILAAGAGVDSAGGAAAEAAEAFRGLDADLADLRSQMRSTAESGLGVLNNAIQNEEGNLAALDIALKQTTDEHAALEKQIQDATATMNKWADASLKGTQAFSDALFGLSQQSDKLQLSLNKIELQALADDFEEGGKASGKLNSMLLALAASLDIDVGKNVTLKEYNELLAAAAEKMDVLRLKSENVNLTKSITIDPQARTLEEILNPTVEYTIDQIVAGVNEATTAVDGYTGALAANAAQQIVLEGMQARHQTALDNLKTAYGDLETKLGEIDPAIQAIWEARGSDVINSIDQAFAAIDRGDKNAADAAMADAQKIFDNIKALVPGAETGVFAPIEKVLRDVQTSVDMDFGAAATTISGAVAGVDTSVAGVETAVTTGFGDVLKQTRDWTISWLAHISGQLLELTSIRQLLSSVPSAQHGGAVLSPGLVRVHAGENIVPSGRALAPVNNEVHLHVDVLTGDRASAERLARALEPYFIRRGELR